MARYNTNITFSEETLNRMFDEISQEMMLNSNNEIKQQNLLMKQAAVRFLNIAKKNEQRMKQIEERAKILKKKRDSLSFKKGKASDEEALKKYNDFKSTVQIEQLQKNQFQDFFEEAMLFNETILTILEGKQLISLVVEGVNGPVILDITLQEFLHKGGQIKADITSNGKLSARLNLYAIQAQSNLESALKGDSILDNTSFEALTETYKIAKNDYSKHSPYAFWKLNEEKTWHGIKIAGGQGDIAQAYSMFAHTYGPKTDEFNTHWKDLDVFFREGVAKVDNISGLYTSDITTQNGYSLAVKAANASLPGFSQMINLANKIVNEEIKDVDQLKKKAEEKKGFKNGVKQKIEYGMRNHIYEDMASIPKKVSIQYNIFNLD